jgi:hypothetical protein
LKIPCPPQADCRELQFWPFEFVSDFVLRISDF